MTSKHNLSGVKTAVTKKIAAATLIFNVYQGWLSSGLTLIRRCFQSFLSKRTLPEKQYLARAQDKNFAIYSGQLYLAI